ncbi:Mak10-domain-containing protein [Xylariomycetidae sp. FL2044]|nr:Mak10-domain-containing protein [Xylariomycetidae sp. FL2044]
MSHPGIINTDITEKFAAAVNTLAPGELIKDEHFTLFESVSALEIMDPKMDSGALAEGESLDEEYDVTRDLLPEEILGIIDQLLCLEMAWHLGYPLSQTLMTSVYVESLMNPRPGCVEEANFVRDPELIRRQPRLLSVLRAYCVGLLKACQFVNDLVKDELYYEEEDFVTNTFDRSLLMDIPASSITSLLHTARSELRAISNDVPKDIATALDVRLELRIAFLRAIDLSTLRGANPDSLKMPWIQMGGLIHQIEKQHSLGKPVPEAFSTKLQRRLASTIPPRPIVQLRFDECIQQFKRLFQDGIEVSDVLKYAEPQSLLTFVCTFQAKKPQPLVYIRTLLQNLLFKDMFVLGKYTLQQILDHDLSIVVLPCGPHIDPSNEKVEVPEDPRHQTASRMHVFRQRVVDSYLDIFRIFCQNRCRVRRTLCHNVQEWDMLQEDVKEIDQLLQVNHDEKPLPQPSSDDDGSGDNNNNLVMGYSLPLSSWAYLYKLRQMEWIVQLGFELDIYQVDELAGMYWYLNYLAKTRAQHGDRIKGFTMRSLADARSAAVPNPPDAAAAENSHRQIKPFTAAMDREYMKSLSYIRVTMLDAACTWEFADGLCCLYTALTRLGLLRAPAARPYGNTDTDDSSLRHRQQRNYEVRMRPFAGIALPQLPTLDEFTRAVAQPDTPLDDLLAYAGSAVGGARKGYEALGRLSDAQAFSVHAHDRWLANVRGCLRAAIAAGLAVATLRKAVEEGEEKKRTSAGGGGKGDDDGGNLGLERGEAERRLGLRVEMPNEGKGYHDWWIVPKLVPVS